MKRFIISTGRSGSTLLSSMVAQNRKVMVLSEFIASMDAVQHFPKGMLSGEDFARLISTVDDIGKLIRKRELAVSENIFDYSRKSRWGPGDDVPTMAMIPLSALSSEPEKLFDEAMAFARARPDALVADHYLALFEFLAKLLGKQVWLERSGNTMRLMPDMRPCFPDGKYLQIHRDGMEAALSLYNHNWFVLGVQYEHQMPTQAEVDHAIRHPSKADDDPIYRHFHKKPPIEWFGQYWSNLVCRGFSQFAALDRDQYTDLRFEDLMADPKARLADLARFFELPDDAGWIDRAAAMVKSDVPARAPNLPEAQYKALEAACLPGNILLGRADPRQLEDTFVMMRKSFAAFETEQKGKRNG